MTALVAATSDDNRIVLWLGVVALAILVAALVWWAATTRGSDEHRRDPDWGSRPSDGMEL